jgi:glycine/D-amino acid oxidase-like deaminating enzyme
MWRVQTPATSYSAPLLVNAAGAWADEVAALAGIDGIGLTPLRRTAVLLDPPAGCDIGLAARRLSALRPMLRAFSGWRGRAGHGIQTAPAAAKLAASRLLQNGLPADLKDAGFDLGWVSPLRLAGS